MRRTREALAARSMHIEKGQTIALVKDMALDVLQRATRLVERPGSDMARNDGIRHPRQPAVPQMHICTADLGHRRPQQRSANRQVRLREFSKLHRHMRSRHHSSNDF